MTAGGRASEEVLQYFYPDREADDAYAIEYEKLYQKGYRGIIFDIDNTLVPHGAPADERARRLFARLREIGYQTCALSNNRELRVKGFCDAVGTRYIHKAGKPGRRGYEQAMERMGTSARNTFFVGDQLFTDVWGARKLGILSCLVRPIHPKEEIQIVLKRKLERIVLYFYHRQGGKCEENSRCRSRRDGKFGGKYGD